jgi:N-acetylmuramoyl-L-alanine amidase
MMHCFAVALLAAVLWASGAGGASAAPTPAPTTTRARDTDYVRITEWAKWQGLKWRWLNRDESFLLTNTAARIQFTVGSREAYYNGVQLWLLYPLVTRGAEIYLSQLDADFTFRPLLAAPRNDPGKKVRTICLDAGHGGRDPGNQASGRQEKDLTLRLAVELREQLQKAGFKVVFSRSTDRYIEHTERADIARKRGADLFLSLHFNGTGRESCGGAGIGGVCPDARRRRFHQCARRRGRARPVLSGQSQQPQEPAARLSDPEGARCGCLDSEDRGVRRARFEVLREATMPAALVEAGFLSHPAEGKRIFTAEYRKQMARAIVEGIQSYKKVVER